MSKYRDQKCFVLVGGGSGGHITPLIAVAEQVKTMMPDVIIVHIGHKNDPLNLVTKKSPFIDKVYEVQAGKFRRYHGESLFDHLKDYKTIFFNVRDFFKFIIGIFQSFRLLGKIRPDNMMMKGGYVCVPVGLAAKVRKIDFFTHDSDVTAGLANKLISRWAFLQARGMPLTPSQTKNPKNVFTGIPLQEVFKSHELGITKAMYKDIIGTKGAFNILVVGGGLGAQKINTAICGIASELIEAIPKLKIAHITGKKLYKETNELYLKSLTEEKFEGHIKLIDFTTELYKYSGAADIVITRAGATNMAEFALQGRACVVIPNPVLTGGQQSENAKVFAQKEAIIIVEEQSLGSDSLKQTIVDLYKNPGKRKNLESNIKHLANPNAAEELAKILIFRKSR